MALFAACEAASAAEPNPPALKAAAISEAVELDGLLTDAAWQGVPAASGFIQREPAVGVPATEATEVKVAFTPAALYIGIRALDSRPREVVARAMQRDAADARYERLDEPFEIRPGIFVPAAEHRFGDLGLWFETNSSRAVSANGWIQQGSFYDGDRLSRGISVRLRPGSHFRSESTWEHQEVELPAGEFDVNLYRQRLTLAVTPDLSTAAFVQLNDAAELLSLNLRFNWIYRPGADLFLVLNESWDATGFGQRTRRDRQAILKVTYLFAI